jgi:opacity protein-like surface antigen
MKKYLPGITQTALVPGLAALVFGAVTVHAQEKGFYLGADVGPNFADKLVPNFVTSGSISLNTGVRGDVYLGYAFGLCDHLTLAPELEVGAIYNSFGNGTVNGENTSGGGDLVQVPILANVILNWNFTSRFSAYGGVGVGAEYFDVSTSDSSTSGVAGTEGDVAWQAELGVKYKLGPGDLGLGYKYLGCSPLFYNTMANHTVEASYTIHF